MALNSGSFSIIPTTETKTIASITRGGGGGVCNEINFYLFGYNQSTRFFVLKITFSVSFLPINLLVKNVRTFIVSI